MHNAAFVYIQHTVFSPIIKQGVPQNKISAMTANHLWYRLKYTFGLIKLIFVFSIDYILLKFRSTSNPIYILRLLHGVKAGKSPGLNLAIVPFLLE